MGSVFAQTKATHRPCAGRAVTAKLPGALGYPVPFFSGMAFGHAGKGYKGAHTMMVATQSRFHRDVPDGEQVGPKPLTFHLQPSSRFEPF
jgi:hypothetical protein